MTSLLDPALARRLAEALPGAELERAQLLGEGWNATAWRVRAAGGAWVVRVPKLEWAQGEIERQSCLMPGLRALGLPVVDDTRVLRDDSGAVAAGLHRYVEGEPARPRGRRERVALARQIGEFLTRLHSTPLEVYQGCGADDATSWWSQVLERAGPYLDLLGPRSRAWVEATIAELEEARCSTPRSVALHDDLQPAHLLLDANGRLTAVLDFSGPRIGDPALDFRRLVQFYDAPFADLAIEHYRGEVDRRFRDRVRLYAALQSLITLHVGVERDEARWVRYARRQIAAQAAAATRSAR
jgi:aminoglycoside phosphotransferase (APT) family kinase protein